MDSALIFEHGAIRSGFLFPWGQDMALPGQRRGSVPVTQHPPFVCLRSFAKGGWLLLSRSLCSRLAYCYQRNIFFLSLSPNSFGFLRQGKSCLLYASRKQVKRPRVWWERQAVPLLGVSYNIRHLPKLYMYLGWYTLVDWLYFRGRLSRDLVDVRPNLVAA